MCGICVYVCPRAKVLTQSRAIVEYVDNFDGTPLGGDTVDRHFVAEWTAQVDAFDGKTRLSGRVGGRRATGGEWMDA